MTWAIALYLLGCFLWGSAAQTVFRTLERQPALQTFDLNIIRYPVIALGHLTIAGALGFWVAGTGYRLLRNNWDTTVKKYLANGPG